MEIFCDKKEKIDEKTESSKDNTFAWVKKLL